MEDEDDFTVVRDKSKHTSYYLTERMYYYLDREKYKDKYRTIRAKLYITRVKRKGDPLFLLQFIMERLTEEEIECQRLKELSKLSKNNNKKLNKQQTTLPSVHSMNFPLHVHPNLIEHFSSQYEDYDKNAFRAQTYPPTSPPSPPKYFKYHIDSNNVSQNILKPLPIKPNYQSQNNFPLPPLSQLTFQYPTYNHYQQQYFNVHNYSQPFTFQPSSQTTTNPLQYQYTLKFDKNEPSKPKVHQKTRSMDVEPPGRWRKDFNMGEMSEDFIPSTERQQKRLLGTTFEERSVKRKSLDIESQNQLNKIDVNINFPKTINQNSGGFV